MSIYGPKRHRASTEQAPTEDLLSPKTAPTEDLLSPKTAPTGATETGFIKVKLPKGVIRYVKDYCMRNGLVQSKFIEKVLWEAVTGKK